MERIRVELGERAYDIAFGPPDTANDVALFAPFINGRTVLLVADSNTAQYLDAVAALCGSAAKIGRAVFPAGEASKSFERCAWLCGEAAKLGCDRRAVFIAVGGGVTGDLTGFAAAIYMRGVDFIQYPTSLLAMVDSSVGGKTGVDLPAGKNLAGAFYQPKLVRIDADVLRTLPRRELTGAMAEVVKYGVIADAAFFDFLEANAARFAGEFDRALYQKIIRRSCELKAATVVADEKESGCRALLNYGHTYGHAAELLSRFELSHGEAVAIGMAIAGTLARNLGMWSAAENDRQISLLQALGLPVRLPGYCDDRAMLEIMGHDKKNQSGKLRLILPETIGRAVIVTDVPTAEVVRAMTELRDK